MDLGTISAAVTSLKAAGNLAQTLIGLKTLTEVQSVAIDLNQKIIDAQHQIFVANTTQTALTDRVRELEKQVTDFENWDAEKQRYELKSIASGSLVYVVKAEMQGTEPPHYICAKCYQDRKKSILQLDPSSTPARSLGKSPTYSCPRCKSTVIAR